MCSSNVNNAVNDIAKRLGANEILIRSSRNMNFDEFHKGLYNLKAVLQKDENRVSRAYVQARNMYVVVARFEYLVDDLLSIIKKKLQGGDYIVAKQDATASLALKKPCQQVFNSIIKLHKAAAGSDKIP